MNCVIREISYKVCTPHTLNLGQERVGGSPRLEVPCLTLLLFPETDLVILSQLGLFPSPPLPPLSAASGLWQKGRTLD